LYKARSRSKRLGKFAQRGISSMPLIRCQGDQIMVDEMGKPGGTHAREEKCMQVLGRET
jgi:hypothetical protein